MRKLIVLAGLVLVACGAPTAATPTPAPVEVTRVVTQVVTQIATEQVTVVVTATPKPVTPTPAEPTPEPTIEARVKEGTTAYALPEPGYKEMAQLEAGETLTVVFRSIDWYAVELPDDKYGWVPAEALEFAEGDADRVDPFSGVLLVIEGDIVQELLATSTLFKGRVVNMGGSTAYDVKVEIETFYDDDSRADIVDGYVDGYDIPAGEARSFETITSFDYASYISRLTWSDTP